MKRIVSILLAMALLLSVGSVLAENVSEYSQSIDLSVDYPVFFQKDITFPLVDEPMTVSVMFPRNANHPEDFSNIWWTKHVAELTGITFDFTLVEDSVWEERKNLAFMSGNYPEVFFAKITQAEQDGKKTFPFTSGSNLYDFIDVDELANMIVAASVQEEINGIINVCTGKPMSLADRVEQFLRDKNYKIKLDYGAFPDRPYDSPGTWGDPTKINRILANDTCKRA